VRHASLRPVPGGRALPASVAFIMSPLAKLPGRGRGREDCPIPDPLAGDPFRLNLAFVTLDS